MPPDVSSRRLLEYVKIGRWDFGSHLRDPLVVRTGRAEGFPGVALKQVAKENLRRL